jgi:hypothetical protein
MYVAAAPIAIRKARGLLSGISGMTEERLATRVQQRRSRPEIAIAHGVVSLIVCAHRVENA